MQTINDLLDAKLLEQHKNQGKRDYLGASVIGDDCLRRIQMQFNQREADFSAQNLKTFAIGHCLEDLIADWIKLVGFDLRTKNENGEQFGFSVADGKLKGHVDGISSAVRIFADIPVSGNAKRSIARVGLTQQSAEYLSQNRFITRKCSFTWRICRWTKVHACLRL